MKRAKLTKKQRAKVFNKSKGFCWYCGNDLLGKRWHADHVEPVYRQEFGVSSKENNALENFVPACAPCNLFKGVFSVEEFRKEIELQAERARKTSVNFRTALRFDQIELTCKPVIFWFETHNRRH